MTECRQYSKESGDFMIKGIGTDIIEIKRIEHIMNKNKEIFLKKVFSDSECEYYGNNNSKTESIAAGFASKEAVMKVLGTGFRGISFKDIEVLRDHLGKPYVNLYGEALRLASSKEIVSIHLSISHSKEYAIAFAVGE